MPLTLNPNTGFRDITGAAYGADAKRHVRGVDSGGQRAVYVNRTVGDRVADWVRRLFSIGPSLAQQRADGAKAVRESLVNQYGVAVAERVLASVAGRSNRSTAQLMRDGVTVRELGQIQTEIARPVSEDDRIRVGSGSLSATQRSEAKRAMTSTVNTAVMGWTGQQAPQGDSAMAQAGRAYRQLDERGQAFVHTRLLAILRHKIETGGSVDEAAIAKTTLKLAGQAASEHFDPLAEQWAAIDRSAQTLMAAARGGDVSALVGAGMAWGAEFDDIGRLDGKAAGAYDDDKSYEDKISSAAGADDILSFGIQSLDDRLNGTAPADAQSAYRRAMASKGPARATLFASNLATLMMPPDYGLAGNKVLNHITRGVQNTASVLGAKGHVDGVADELGVIRDSVSAALNEVCALTDTERSKVEQETYAETKDAVGLDNPDAFDREYDARLKKALSQARNRKKAPLQNLLAEKGPFSNDPAIVGLMDVAMAKAGVGDKAQVRAAYDALMAAAQEAAGPVERYRSDTVLSDAFDPDA